MKNRHLFFILFIAGILLVAITLSLSILSNYNQAYFIYPDANSYVTSAHLLYKQGFTPHYIRPIGWPLIIGLPYLFNPEATKLSILHFSIFINLVCWLLSIYYIYKTIKLFSTDKVAFTGAAIFVLLISNIILIYQSMTEGFFVLLLVLFAYNLLQYILKGNVLNLFYSCVFIFYSAITRPANFYPAIVTLIIALVFTRKQLKYAFAILSVFILTVGLQLYLVNRTYGKPVVSFIKNHTAYFYLFARAEYFTSPEKWDNNYEIFYKERETKVKELAIQDSISANGKSIWPYLDKRYKENISYNMKNNPAEVFKQFLFNILENATTGAICLHSLKNPGGNTFFETSRKTCLAITAWQNIIATLFFLVNWAAIFILFLRKRFTIPLFTGIIILQLVCSYFLITSGISFWQGDRFNYVFAPITLIVSTYLYTAYKQHSSRKAARA